MRYIIQYQWGYQMHYMQLPFHHEEYKWDGRVDAENGRILGCRIVKYDGVGCLFGVVPFREIPLDRNSWTWRAETCNKQIGGLVVEIDGSPDTVVHWRTRTMDISLTIAELQQQRRVRRHIGWRYNCVYVNIFWHDDDYRNYSAAELEEKGRQEGRWLSKVEAVDTSYPLEVVHASKWIVLAKGDKADIMLPDPQYRMSVPDERRAVTIIMTCTARHMDAENRQTAKRRVASTIRYQMSVNGQAAAEGDCTFLTSDIDALGREIVQCEEIIAELPAELFKETGNILTVRNAGVYSELLLTRLYVEETAALVLEWSVCPRWVLSGRSFPMEIKCRETVSGLSLELPDGVRCLSQLPSHLEKGLHRWMFVADQPLVSAPVMVSCDGGHAARGVIEQVYAGPVEPIPMLVGLDNVCFTPEVPSKTEELFKYMTDRQMCDRYTFRSAIDRPLELGESIKACHRYGISYTLETSVNPDYVKILKLQDDPLFKDGYRFCEWDGGVFGYAINSFNFIPIVSRILDVERTMRTAAEAQIEHYRTFSDQYCERMGGGVQKVGHMSTITHHYAYAAGCDNCVTQTNKSNNTLILSEARGALRASGADRWAVYIAEGAHVCPEDDYHQNMWWLSLYLSYIMGAVMVDDEQHLVKSWHSILYTNHDKDIVKRQQIMADFNRYVKTHPRNGRLQVRQAVLLGRYSCDVADGLNCPDGKAIKVWRHFGGEGQDWDYLTPEYGMRCLDVFFPSVWLVSLVQPVESVRRFYTGSPMGETELVSIDASLDVLMSYKLLILLGWNTMDEEQYVKLRQYVEQGGRLFMAVPHATANESRKFLLNGLEPLNLVKGGDFTDLFGVRVLGKGGDYRSIEINENIPFNPVKNHEVRKNTATLAIAGGPRHEPVRMAAVELSSAEVLAFEGDSGEPVLVRNRLGRGEAYLLTTWEYPGNSWISGFASDAIREIARTTETDIELDDPSYDVYYTVRDEGQGVKRIHLINTDWTEAGNIKPCDIRLGLNWYSLSIAEGNLVEMIWISGDRPDHDFVLINADPKLTVESAKLEPGRLTVRLHGYGYGRLEVASQVLTDACMTIFDGCAVEICRKGELWSIEWPFPERSNGELVIELPDS